MSVSSKTIAVVASDCHIRSGMRLFPNSAEPSGDILVSFRQITDVLNALSDTPLILAGDVFDTKTCTASMVDTFRRVMAELEGILSPLCPLYFIQGQHDATVPPWLELLSPDTVHMHDKRINISGVDFVGVDFCYRLSDLRGYLEKYRHDSPYVLVTHFPYSFVAEAYDMLSEYDNLLAVLSGDNHVPFYMKLKNGTPFYSVGAMCPNRISDTNKFSYLMVQLKGSNDLVIEPVSLITRPVFGEDVFSSAHVDALLEQVKVWMDVCPYDEIRRPVVVIYTNDTKLITYANYLLSEHCYLFIRTHSRKEQEVADPVVPDQGFIELKDMFKRYITEKFGEEFNEVAGNLFEACRSNRDARTGYLKKVVDILWQLFEEAKNAGDRDSHKWSDAL